MISLEQFDSPWCIDGCPTGFGSDQDRSFQDVENLHVLVDDFHGRKLLADANLLFAPSQLAMAAVVYAASKARVDSNEYLNVSPLIPLINLRNSDRNVPWRVPMSHPIGHYIETLFIRQILVQDARRICKEMHLIMKDIQMPAKEQVKRASK